MTSEPWALRQGDVTALAQDGRFYTWQQIQEHYGAAAQAYWDDAEEYCEGGGMATLSWLLQGYMSCRHSRSAQQQHAGSSSSGQQQQAVHDFQPARAGNLIQKQPCSSADSATS